MSLERKSSSEPHVHNSNTPTSAVDVYYCHGCGEQIEDHVYRVQQRHVRPVTETDPQTGETITNKHDVIHPWHAGVKLGPGFDNYCPKCYENIPTVQELLDAYHARLHS